MRGRAWVLACIIALLAPAALPALGAYDPLLLDEVLWLGSDGTIAREAPPAGAVAAPTSLPGQEGTAVWAYEAPFDGAFAADVIVRLLVRVTATAPLPPQDPALHVALLHAGAPVAEAESVLALSGPGDYEETFTLPAAGLAFAAGDGLGLAVTLRSLNLQPAPAVAYVVGPEASGLRVRARAASLDALEHVHAATDAHYLFSEYKFAHGDLGGGRWGTDLTLGGAPGPQPYPLRVPANVSRVLLQLYLEPEQDDDPAAPRELALELPGGPLTVYRGEVVVREVAFREGAELRCVACGAGGQGAALARLAAVEPPPVSSGAEPLTPTSGAGPAPVRPAAGGDDILYVLVMAVPAGLMLLGSIGYVMRGEASWGEARRRPAPRSLPSAPSRR